MTIGMLLWAVGCFGLPIVLALVYQDASFTVFELASVMVFITGISLVDCVKEERDVRENSSYIVTINGHTHYTQDIETNENKVSFIDTKDGTEYTVDLKRAKVQFEKIKKDDQ